MGWATRLAIGGFVWVSACGESAERVHDAVVEIDARDDGAIDVGDTLDVDDAVDADDTVDAGDTDDAGDTLDADVGDDGAEVGPGSCTVPDPNVAAPLPDDREARPAAAIGRPIVIDRVRDLGLAPGSAMASMAAHPSARRVYLGRYGSYDPARRDLFVVALDAEGAVVRTRTVAVTPEPRPHGKGVSVTDLVPAAEHGKLYLGFATIVGAEEREACFGVLDLDGAGEPTGPARTFACDLPYGSLYALARGGDQLFMGGYGDGQIHRATLDAAGEPTGERGVVTIDDGGDVVAGGGIAELVVSADGRHLYVGGTGVVDTFVLAADGRSATRVARLDLPPLPNAGSFDYARMTLAGERLVRRACSFPAGPQQPVPRTSIVLEAGVPTRVEVEAADVYEAIAVGDEVVFVEDAPFRDTLTGEDVHADLALVRGVPGADTLAPLAPIARHTRATALLGDAFADGTPVVLLEPRPAYGSRVKDLRLRATVRAAEVAGAPVEADAALMLQLFVVGSDYYEAAEVHVGAATPWLPIDRAVAGAAWPFAAMWIFAGDFTRTAITVELALGDPDADGRVLAAVDLEAAGPNLIVRVPGLGLPEPELAAALVPEGQVAEAHATLAASVGLAPGERPRRYTIGCYSLIGAEANVASLRAMAATVASLGCNMVIPIGWESLPPEVVRTALDEAGIDRRAIASYTPPSYFDFELDTIGDDALEAWADEAVHWALIDGSSPDALGHATIADEPAWYYPTMIDVVRGDAHALEVFQAFVAERSSLAPDDFGVARWDEVMPLGKPADTAALSRAERVRLYWTLRFFPVSAARGLGRAAAMIRAKVGRALPVHVNWNNWGVLAWHYNDYPVQVENNPTRGGPERGTGSVDWYEVGRTAAHTLYTEDWVPDAWADLWSYRLDTLRTAAMQRDDGAFGAYVIPNAAGEMRDGLSYKILSVLGRGGSLVDFFNFGPTTLQSDGWSDNTGLYPMLARALRRVGAAEHVMYGATPERGRVALLLPSEGLFFDEWSETDYTFEAEGLHRALIRGGFRVDVVDATMLATGALARDDYRALYLTVPNVPDAARAEIAAWVARGGTLVVTPGAATADAYDTPAADLDAVLGVAPRPRVRAPSAPPFEVRAWIGVPASARLASDAAVAPGFAVVGRVDALEPNDAEVVAAFEDGRAAITRRAHGAGDAYAYAFMPGAQVEAGLGRAWIGRFADGAEAARALATWPARAAEAWSSVRSDADMVEVLRLDGANGIALVVLDWGSQPRSCVRFTVADVGARARVRSIEGAAVSSRRVGDGLELELERLDGVDVILIEP